jgi:DNA-binding response OmpR family regulator
VPFSPKAFDLLELLIRRRPKAVSKADIHEHLWPGTFVSPANLANLVGELRAALGGGRGGHKIKDALSFGVSYSFSPAQLVRRAFPPKSPVTGAEKP